MIKLSFQNQNIFFECYVSLKYHCDTLTSVFIKNLATLSHNEGKAVIVIITWSLKDILVSNVLRSTRFFISLSL